MALPTLPAEILHKIVHELAHDWEEGPFATVFGSPILTNDPGRFNAFVVDQFLMALKDLNLILYKRFLSMDLAGPVLVMVEGLLRMLVTSCLPNPIERNSRYISANAIAIGTKEAVRLLAKSGSRDSDPDTIRRAFFDALIAIDMVPMRSRLNNLLLQGYSEDEVLEDAKRKSSSALALAAAAYMGRIDHMERLVALGADIHGDPSNEWTCPLVMAAALSGQMEALKHLARCGIDLACHTDRNGNGAIHFAVMGGHAEAVKFLIKAGADPISPNKDSERPIDWAVKAGQAANQGAAVPSQDQRELPIASAAFFGDVELLQLILPRTDLEKAPVDNGGCTPLILAARENHLEALNLLLADPEATTDMWRGDSKGQTMLEYAASKGHLQIVTSLLDPALGVPEVVVHSAIPSTMIEITKIPASTRNGPKRALVASLKDVVALLKGHAAKRSGGVMSSFANPCVRAASVIELASDDDEGQF
ncbi:ankyrin repeat-containing domain protein [Aspergillus multicolor]|uniref:ankyrin repeat domain-containing protein n=1 Tax=Aspergillus multicolor TaxID=41759 RepID=UPI003CCD06B8